MPRQEYDWKDGPAILGPHSVAKHTILREYVERYIYILTRSGTVPDFRLLLIDGFAGGGEYVVQGQGSKIHDGSPLVLMGAVQAATARINAVRKNPINLEAKFVFIEKKRDNFAYLNATLSKRFPQKMLDERVTVIHGAFEEHIGSIINRIKSISGRKPRPIFVLDQYGYTGVPIDMIATIMNELPNAEVFLTLAVDWISAYTKSRPDAILRVQKSLHIGPLSSEFLEGRREMEALSDLSDEDKNMVMLEIQRLLHEAFATQSGAKCYTPFFIMSRGSNRSYWFLHLANNPRANDVVKDLHWQVSNHFKHYGGAGTKMLMLGYDPGRQQLSFDFDESAKSRTEHALLAELPGLIRQKYPNGVSFKDLYADICNETPASKNILARPVNVLCREGEIEKLGAKGEERHPNTTIKDGDIIRMPAQGTLYLFPSKNS